MFYEILKASKGLPVTDHLAALWGQKIAEGGAWQLTTIAGTLPLTVLANGKALKDYKIYGAVDGAGVETESGEPHGYKLPMVSRTKNLFDKNDVTIGYFFLNDGRVQRTTDGGGWSISGYIPVDIGAYVASGLSKGGYGTYCCVYDANKNFIRSQLIVANTDVNFNIAADEKFVRLSVRNINHEADTAMFTEGSTAPEQYIPYHRTETPVYIGDTQLMEGEYVDYGEQKIYKLADGVLTPTDPPVPFPEITLPNGEATIDIEGDVKPQAVIIGEIKEI